MSLRHSWYLKDELGVFLLNLQDVSGQGLHCYGSLCWFIVSSIVIAEQKEFNGLFSTTGPDLKTFGKTSVLKKNHRKMHFYLRQGGNVFAGVCLLVCLSVSNITRKVVDGFG